MKPRGSLWRKTTLNWLGAYALVVVFVVLLVGLISFITLNAVENSARIEQQTRMQNLRIGMDVMLADVDNTLARLAADERLNVLLSRTPPYTPYELYLLYDVNRSMPRQISNQGAWNSIYVYIKQGEFILFNNGKFDLPAAYKQLDYGLSIEAWKEKLDLQSKHVYLSLPSASELGRTYLEYWFPIGAGPENSGMLVARLNLSELQNRLGAMRSFNDELLLLLDEHGHILFTTQPVDEITAGLVSQMASEADTLVETNDLLAGYAHSKISAWTYVSILPRDFLFSRSVFTRQVAWTVIAIVLVVGIVLSIVAALKTYLPIKRLYDLAKQSTPGDEPADAYGFLETSMRDMVKRNIEVQQTMHQYHGLLRQDALLRLLSGVKVDSDLLKTAEMQFHWDSFMVFIASCENAEDLFFGEYNDDAQALALVAMGDVLRKTFARDADVYTIVQEDQIVGVMSLPGDLAEEKVLDLAQEGQQVLKSQMGLAITLAISDLRFGVDNIAMCYEHAKESWECQVLIGSERGALVRYQVDKGDGSYAMDLEAPIAFSRAIKKGDFPQAKAVVGRSIDTYLASAHPVPDMARALMFTFLNTMLDAMRTAEIPFDEDFLTELRPTQRMLACPSIRELRSEMDRLMDEASLHLQQMRSDQGKYINSIKAFVQEKYVDTNMNVSGIALEMGMSVSGLSKLFKKKTDMGLLNYINQIRIEQACRLLTTSDLTLSEIAEKTGFLNSSTLIRNFKRTMGVTPGKYKLQKG